MKQLFKTFLLWLLIFVQVLGQVSKPIYTSKISQNSSNSKYAGLYWIQTKKTNGDIATQWYWINTNSVGVISPVKAKRLNGYFSSESNALANLPSGYSIVTGGGSDFETVTLPAIIAGTNDVAPNYYGLSDFPTTPVNTTQYYPKLIQGSGVEYNNVGGVQVAARGLATGFGNQRMWTAAELGAEHRSLWRMYSPSNVGDYEGHGGAEANILFNNHSRDKNEQAVSLKWFLSDTETYQWFQGQNMPLFLKGFINTAVTRYSSFTLYAYGRALTAEYPTFNPRGDERYVFPKIDPTLLASHTVSSGVIQSYLANKQIVFDCSTYYKATLPQSTELWQKSGANYITDGDGNRIPVDTQVSETIRGVTHTWGLKDPNAAPDVVSGENYRRKIHEWQLGVIQPYIIYARIVTAMKMIKGLSSQTDISDFHSTSAYKLGIVGRLTCEANTWTSAYRPLDQTSAATLSFLGLGLAKNMWWWDSFNGVDGLTTANSANEGNQVMYNDGYSTYRHDWHNGALRQSWGVNYWLQKNNRDYGFGKSTNKLLFFTDYKQLDATREMLGFGEISNDRVQVVLHYPYLGLGETCTVTLGNTQNGVTHTITLNGYKDVKAGVYQFAGVTNLQPSQVKISYVTVRNKDNGSNTVSTFYGNRY